MITAVKPKKILLKVIQIAKFDFYNQLECNILPTPLAVSFSNFFQSNSAKDKHTVLTAFAHDLTNSCLHFLALLAFCDYVQSKTAKTAIMYDAIESMLTRPGPGKWLGFLRTYYHYTKEADFESRIPGVVSFIEKHEISKNKNPVIEVYRNYSNENPEEMGLLEFMVAFRNSLAHSKGYDEATANAIVLPLMDLAAQLAKELSFLASYNLELASSDKTDKSISVDDLKVIIENTVTEPFLESEKGGLSLYPMFLSDKVDAPVTNAVYLLESVKGAKALYSCHSGTMIKSRGEHPCAARLFELLTEIYVEPRLIDENKVTWQKLKERSHNLLLSGLRKIPSSNQTLQDESHTAIIKAFKTARESFFNSGKRALFLSAGEVQAKDFQEIFLKPGSWNLDETRDIIIPILPDRVNEYLNDDEPFSFEKVISAELGVSGDLQNIIRTVSLEQSNARLFLLLDEPNQISFKEKHVALKHIFDFVYRFKDLERVFFIIHATSEYYLGSFSKYMQVFRDKIEDITYINNNRVVVSLFERNEEKSGRFSKMIKLASSLLKK